jgi:erythromycin esterase-like protein
VAFYGLDLYSFYTSMDEVVEYLEKVSPEVCSCYASWLIAV